jgi:uncharacterized protein YjbJ (UPF0337 family)
MSKHEKAEQARKDVIDSIKGKAKEIVGAVTGNDSLTAEGQLEQTQAQQRKETNSVEAVADAEAAQARAEAADARVDSAHKRTAVNAETAAVENSVREQQYAHKRAAEQSARQDAARAETRAELDVQREVQRAKAEEREEISAATEQAVDAAAEHQSSVQATSTAQAEADRIRRQADKLSDEADLP